MPLLRYLFAVVICWVGLTSASGCSDGATVKAPGGVGATSSATFEMTDTMTLAEHRAFLQASQATVRTVVETVYVDRPVLKKKLARAVTRPCDRPRPYKSWSNSEINVALLENMGTEDVPNHLARAFDATGGRTILY